MNAKVAVAQEIVELCTRREGQQQEPEFKAEFKRIREAFTAVIVAAASSQPAPPDFQNGQPGLAPCKCTWCTAAREREARERGSAT